MDIHDKINFLIAGTSLHFHSFVWKVYSFFRKGYFRMIGGVCGKNVIFQGKCEFWKDYGSRMVIGDNCSFNSKSRFNHIGMNHRCILSTMDPGAELIIGNNVGVSAASITAFKSVRIGNNVRIGANCVIMDGDFHLDDPRVGAPKPVVIGDNVWLGYGVIVQKGVTIGENSVIGMNSVVTHDIPANVMAAGMPAKVIKSL